MGKPVVDTTPEPDGSGVGVVERNDTKRRAIVMGVAVAAVVAVCAGGYGVWRAHENRLDEQARTDCSQAAKTLKSSRATWERLLKDAKTGAGAIQANQVKDAKTVDALKQAMGAKTPTGSASCTAGGRNDVEDAATAIRKAAGTYDTDARTLRTAVKAVEASKLDKTVADASKLLDDTKGKVSDDRTRQTLDKAIKARDEQAITKAVKAVNDFRTAKEKADAEARAEQEAAAAQSSGANGSYSGNSEYSAGSYSGSQGYSYSGSAGSSVAPATGGTTSSNGGGSASNSGVSTSGGASSGMPYIPPTSSCSASITGACSTDDAGELWW
ncbi:colicin transporter [Bifidobacterium angulatum]|uniref:colicin transporter n=1 Tax=Bifidobacterium angulatum TaxID=1683 RepID=UPI00265B0FAD|nr:colicin transporter [Bifidobacterium angulatum]